MREHEAILTTLQGIFDTAGEAEYLGESVTMAAHMLQAAWFAERDDAGDEVVAGALLHDVGHLLNSDAEAGDWHRHHDEAGGAWLSRYFTAPVADAARLHVLAKRYLCSVEPDYFQQLSAPSVHTLKLQGGRMSDREIEAFRAEPSHRLAISVRRYDERGKQPGLEVPGFDHYRPVLQRCLLV